MPQPHFFDIGGVQLKNQRLDSFDALDVASKLLPFVSGLVPLIRPLVLAVEAMPSDAQGASDPGDEAAPQGSPDAPTPPVDRQKAMLVWATDFLASPANQEAISKAVRSAFSEMPDADRRFIVTKCLGAVRKATPDGKTFVPIMSGGHIVFQELASPIAMLAITTIVVKDMLGDFLSDPAWSSIAAAFQGTGQGSSLSAFLGGATGSGGR